MSDVNIGRFEELAVSRRKLKEENDLLRIRLAEVEGEAAVVRSCLMSFLFDENGHLYSWPSAASVSKALSTDAGKSLLERLKEAEALLSRDNWHHNQKDWNAFQKRRDAFLDPTNKDVK